MSICSDMEKQYFKFIQSLYGKAPKWCYQSNFYQMQYIIIQTPYKFFPIYNSIYNLNSKVQLLQTKKNELFQKLEWFNHCKKRSISAPHLLNYHLSGFFALNLKTRQPSLKKGASILIVLAFFANLMNFFEFSRKRRSFE